jgi:pimeloyl-ACP methyl ester carboxylesterase
MTTVNRYSLKCVENGNGEPLVLVHGSASDYRTWQAQLEAFSKHFHTLAYSRRHHWPNQPISDGADYAMAEHVRDLEALIRAPAIGPVHLVGHSYGAFVCLLVAIQSPQLVRSLVLAEPPVITLFVSNSPKPSELLKLLVSRPRAAAAILKFGAMGIAPATAAARRGDMEETLRLFGTAALGKDAFNSFSAARLEQSRANLIKAELLGTGFPPLDIDALRKLNIPALLVSGEASPRLYYYLLERLQELLPNNERVEIPGAAHIMHEDNAPAYNQAVLSFVARHRGAV